MHVRSCEFLVQEAREKLSWRSFLIDVPEVYSGVARIWCEEGDETKIKHFKGDTQKYYEIHAINSDKAVGQYTVLLAQPHEVECQSLCGSEVTQELNSWNRGGGTCRRAIAGDANGGVRSSSMVHVYGLVMLMVTRRELMTLRGHRSKK